MANIKSAKKRISVNEKKKAQNNMIKSELKTDIKKFKAAIAAKEYKLASELYIKVESALDSAASENVIHKNKADRNKSKFAKILNAAKTK